MSLPFPHVEEPGPSLTPDGCDSEEITDPGKLSNDVNASKQKPIMFSEEQRTILLRYFDEHGMVSTHRKNHEIMARCAQEVGTSLDRIKNWIGSEAVKRKRKAGILPRPKVEITQSPGEQPSLQILQATPPTKKVKKLNGYNVFFSFYVRNNPTLTTNFKERNALVGQKWSSLTNEERKAWGQKAESLFELSTSASSEIQPSQTREEIEPEIIEATLMKIQEKFDLLQQLGFEGYAILINTNELQSHFFATQKGKNYHRARQKQGRPLENPFIGYVFSEESDEQVVEQGDLQLGTQLPRSPTLEALQRSVMNAFALKYRYKDSNQNFQKDFHAGSLMKSGVPMSGPMEQKIRRLLHPHPKLSLEVAVGKTDIPYGNLQNLGCHVIGMPLGIPFHNPLLYTEQQLNQILTNLDKIVFLRVQQDGRDVTDLPASLLSGADVEIDTST